MSNSNKNESTNKKNNNSVENNKNNNSNNYFKIFESLKDKLILAATIFDSNNIVFYLSYFTIFFFLYFTLTAKYINSAFEALYERNKKNGWFILFYYGGLVAILCLWIYFYYSNIGVISQRYVRLKLIISGIFVIFLLFNFTQVFLKYLSIYLPDIFLIILLVLFFIFNIVFFILYLTMFLMNINKRYNIEACIALEMLILIYSINSSNVSYNENNVLKNLRKHDFNYASLNCFISNPSENYKNNSDNNTAFYIDKVLEEKGNDYLQFKQNIPIKYKNGKTGNYEDLILADFYYPGSYKSYLADTPLNGTPDEKALIKALTFYKVRIITLDIFSDLDDEFSPNAEPVVRSENTKEGKKSLNLKKCFQIINEHAWIPNNNNGLSYPFFLILEFHFDNGNDLLYEKIRNLIDISFRRYLMSNKYDFNGHNGKDFIGQAKMEDCLGKIIIVTNRYPVGPLNELVNCSVGKKAPNNSNNGINLDLYTKDMVKFEGTGASQKYSKTEITNHCKTKIKFFHTEPNKDYENKEQAKAGLYNPLFQDTAQYGVQSTLMYLYLPDPNLNKWYLYFQKKSNFDPILKAEELRFTELNQETIKPQSEIKGIGKPQKYCMMKGDEGSDFYVKESSNIGTGSQNNSCN
tara:strand:+ start:406 stop:2310 length:1905 start_codon:yes stop_codon:yes gene_type:complete